MKQRRQDVRDVLPMMVRFHTVFLALPTELVVFY